MPEKIKTAADFKRALLEIGRNRTEREMELIVKKLAFDSYRMITNLTPIDTGHLRNNWDIAVDTPPQSSVLSSPDSDKKYGEPDPNPSEFNNIKFNSVVHIYNNTEYAGFIEEGTPNMGAQPMIYPAEQALFYTAEVLANSLSKKRYA